MSRVLECNVDCVKQPMSEWIESVQVQSISARVAGAGEAGRVSGDGWLVGWLV